MPPSRAELAAKHQRVRELAAAGHSTGSITRTLGMDRRSVRTVRAEAGIAALPGGTVQSLTVEQKWAKRVRETDGGHLEWTGETTTAGARVMRHSGIAYTAHRIAYRIYNGTDPEGHAKPDCGWPACVAPAHQIDTATRRAVHTPRVHYANPQAKFQAFTEPVDGGHLRWTCSTNSAGYPLMAWGTTHLLPTRLAFAARYGREPVGPVTAACEHPHCVDGDHLDDTVTRKAHRNAYAALGL